MEPRKLDKQKLRFLIISADKYPPFRSDVVVLFGNEMIKRGHKIDWILQSDKPCKYNYITQWMNSRVFVGKTKQGSSALSSILKHLYGILNDLNSIKLILSNRYDIIQVKDKFISTLFIIAFTKLKNYKFVFWLSYPYPEASLLIAKESFAKYPTYYLIRGIVLKFLLYKIIIPKADHVFVQSTQMKNDITKMGISSDKLSPVPMGVEDSLLNRPKTNKISRNNNIIKVVYLGTMAKVRRIDFLVKVFKHVIDTNKNIKFYMVGDSEDPNDLAELKSLAKSFGINAYINFTGNLDREVALDYVSESDICLSPFYPTPILNSTSPTKLI